MKENIRIGWIGTGVMGRPMCGHLLKAGYTCIVYNHTQSKSQPLIESGAVWADSPAEVAAVSDVVFTMVGYPADVRQVLLGPSGVFENLDQNGERIVVDCTTSSPTLARLLALQGHEMGIEVLDAPVSGGDIGARNASLSMMIGGGSHVIDYLGPLWRLMAKTIVHQGGPGTGQHAKMVNQILIAGNMVGLCEALVYAQKSGLNLNTVLESVSGGAAGSWSLSNLAPRIIAGNYSPGFYIEHFVKDLGIALDEAAAMNLALPGLAQAKQLYMSAVANGLARNGTQALILTLRQMSGLEMGEHADC